MASVSTRMLRTGPRFAQRLEHRTGGAADIGAAEIFHAQPLPRVIVINPGYRIARAHLRPMTAQRGDLARHPRPHVDRERIRQFGLAERIPLAPPETPVAGR